jgi:RNA polymerase sigma-70 factor (ECF subfamily)
MAKPSRRTRSLPNLSAADAVDEELLLRYRDGRNVDAFNELTRRYRTPIYNYMVRYLHNTDLAEEAVQTTLLRVHQKCHLYASGRPIRPWLYRIASHVAIDILRREGRHQSTSLDERHTMDESAVTLIDLLQSEAHDPSEQVESHEQRQWIHKAVSHLPEPQRDVVRLIYFRGLKYREAAKVLSIPMGTVYSRLHRALKQLLSAWRQKYRDFH